MDSSKEYLETNKKGISFEERLQLLARAWKIKWKDAFFHSNKLLRSYASGYFNKVEARDRPFNLTDRGVGTVVPFLVEGNPKMDVQSRAANLRATALKTKLALNYYIDKKLNLAENVFIPAATMSMFGGVAVRTFSEYNRQISLDNEVIKAGTPRVVVIDQVDYIGDPAARSRNDFVIEGDVYRIPTEYAKDIFDHPDEIEASGKLVDELSAEKISSPNFKWNSLNLREYTVFQDIYIKDEGIIVTIQPYGNKPCRHRTVSYDGPGDGPYDYLGYKYFPGCPIPIPPAWAWNDLDVTMNEIGQVARKQAESQKNVIIAEPASKKAAEKLIKASNMDVIVARNAKGINTVSLGGVNAENYNWMGFIEGQFTKSGANPDILGGRGSDSPTLGQEQMVFRNATRVINNWHTRFESFMTSVVSKLAYYIWTDPKVYIPVIDMVPGYGEMDVVFSQADKVGDFYDFVFSIKPYSAHRKPPELEAQEMLQFMSQWILPTAQIAAAQGAQLDIPTATQIMADYKGFDNFNQIYKTAVPSELDGVNYTMQPMKSKGRFGQMNDSMGATEPSKLSNLAQQQDRATKEEGTDL